MWEARGVRGSKRDAERALAALVTEQSSSLSLPAGPSKTFGELLDRWFEARSGDWSPSTAQQTRWIINGRYDAVRGPPAVCGRGAPAVRRRLREGPRAADLRRLGGRDRRPAQRAGGASVRRLHRGLRNGEGGESVDVVQSPVRRGRCLNPRNRSATDETNDAWLRMTSLFDPICSRSSWIPRPTLAPGRLSGVRMGCIAGDSRRRRFDPLNAVNPVQRPVE